MPLWDSDGHPVAQAPGCPLCLGAPNQHLLIQAQCGHLAVPVPNTLLAPCFLEIPVSVLD